jgi:transcriptional regulator with XRE-family HTH domain
MTDSRQLPRLRRRRPSSNAFARWLDSPPLVTLAEVAAQLGVHMTTVANWRRGVRLPSADMKLAIEDLTLGIVKVTSWPNHKRRAK